MSSAPIAGLVVLMTLSAVLTVSGLSKLRDPPATRDAFDALRVPGLVPAGAGARMLPWAEVVLAVLLLVAPGGWLVPVTLTAVLLMLAYALLVARALGFDERVSCSCFGSLGRHEVDRTTLGRNVLLVILAVAAAWFALDGGSAPATFADLDAAGWAALGATAAAAAVAVLVVDHRSTGQGELLDYERRPIPYGVLTRPGGPASSLWDMTSTHALLLVVLSPGCTPCIRTAERLDDWAAQLAPAVKVVAVYPDETSASGATQHSPELTTWEPELNVRRGFSVGTPAAVLLGADGLMAGGPVDGENKVARFVDDVLAAVVEEPDPTSRGVPGS